jgi:hypothetical protein
MVKSRTESSNRGAELAKFVKPRDNSHHNSGL